MTHWSVHTGDCLEVMVGMRSNTFDAIVTDPPYCSGGRQQAGARATISKSRRTNESGWFIGDNMGIDTYLWWMREIANQSLRVCTQGSQAHVFTDWRQYGTIVNAWESVGWTLRSALVWDKAKGGAMGSYWRNNHEWVAIFCKGKNRPLPNHSFFNTWSGTKPKGGHHPTEKPLALMRYLCAAQSPAGGTILDPFAGSGTTGVAARLEGFGFVGIEREPDYADIARARIGAVEPALIGGLS